MRRVLLIAPLVVIAPLLLTACSSSATLAKADVEKGAADALTRTVGKAPDSVTCPSDLDAQAGASERCTLTSGGTSIGLTVTVASYDSSSNTAQFTVKVDASPSPGGATSSDSGGGASTQTESSSST